MGKKEINLFINIWKKYVFENGEEDPFIAKRLKRERYFLWLNEAGDLTTRISEVSLNLSPF